MKEFFWKDLSGRGFTNTFTEEELLATIPDEMENCEECDGSGKKRYPAKYLDGYLYHDAETLECDECGGACEVRSDHAISLWAASAEVGDEWSDNANKVIRIK